jgi:hypothetical protein
MKNKVSPEVEAQALKTAKATQKPGQTKEQTKLIAQGIEKGIAEYKKQQGKKLREIDKQRKQSQKAKLVENKQPEIEHENAINQPKPLLPWILLAASWLGFVVYIGFEHLG